MDNLVVLDIEIYPNYSLFAFKNIDNNKTVTIEMAGVDTCLTTEQARKLKTILFKRTTFGFNSRNYDMPLLLMALKFKTCFDLFEASNDIIENSLISWQTMQRYDLNMPTQIDHFDIQEPAPGVRISLKLYGGRMHSKRLQDLPIEPGQTLTNDDMAGIKTYCINDLDTTIDLYRNVESRIKLRVDMSKEYGQDLRSKSDAQIAEAVIKSELQRITPEKRFKAPKLDADTTFKYKIPEFIKFTGTQLNDVLDFIRNHDFELDKKGSIKLPKDLRAVKITLGNSVYQMGIGGIHSTEKKQAITPSRDEVLVDRDVAAYYPSIILNQKLYPKHLGKPFLDVYGQIVNRRLEAKKSGNKVVNESLKIVINGSFGKLGSKYSILYSPDLLLAVTLSGQLSLLMLIEVLENQGIRVVSANTDGFVSIVPKNKYELYDSLCLDWELTTGFILEETQYKSLYSRDVNNYLAITDTGSKGKGVHTAPSIGKNPQAAICAEAVSLFLTKNIPVESSVKTCTDVRKFLFVRSVTGGAVFRGDYLGRVVRWVYSTDGDKITYKKNGNKVAKSDGSRPIMKLDGLPDDVDFDRYVKEASDMLEDLGVNLNRGE